MEYGGLSVGLELLLIEKGYYLMGENVDFRPFYRFNSQSNDQILGFPR